jgi:hypothetical protein
VSTGGIPAAQQPPDYSSSPFVFHSSPLSADARTLSSFKHYSPSKEFGSNQGEEAPEYFADRGVSSTSRKTVSPDIPSPIANTIDELTVHLEEPLHFRERKSGSTNSPSSRRPSSRSITVWSWSIATTRRSSEHL